MSSKSADSPDYRGAAEAQGESALENMREATRSNRPNQYTPWGSSEWSQGEATFDPTTGERVEGAWTQNIALDPELEQALDAQQAVQRGRSELASTMIGRTAEELSSPFAWDSMPSYGKAPTLTGYDPSSLPETSNPFTTPQYESQFRGSRPRGRGATQAALRNV